MPSCMDGLNIDDGGEGGVPVVLIPSAAGSVRQWSAQLEHLRRTRRAIAVELRGHGESRTPARRDATVEQFSEDLEKVADGLMLDRFVLVGHSFGGAVAASYAARHPERVHALLLVDPASDGRQIPAELAQGFLQALSNEATFRQTVEEYWAPMLADSRRDVRERVLSDLGRTPQDTVCATLSCLLSFDPVAALESYPGPKRSLITRFNEEPNSYQNLVKNLPTEKVEGVGHWLQLDAPEKVNAAIDRFLREVEALPHPAR